MAHEMNDLLCLFSKYKLVHISQQKVHLFQTSQINRESIPVELDKHQIPDLQDIGIIHIHQVSSVPSSDTVEVDLTAGTAGPSVSHLPEIILHAAW